MSVEDLIDKARTHRRSSFFWIGVLCVAVGSYNVYTGLDLNEKGIAYDWFLPIPMFFFALVIFIRDSEDRVNRRCDALLELFKQLKDEKAESPK